MDATGGTTPTTTQTPRPGRYTIDPDGSTLSFRTTHVFGLLPVRGTFTLRCGSVDVADPLSGSRVRAEADAGSFRSGNAQRDGAVRSARFLDTGTFPLITFVSEEVDAHAVSGMLTAHGVSRPVRLSVVQLDVRADDFTVRATLQVDRTEFGVTASPGMAGRRLDLTLEARCVRG
ncbi:YceI family protein [Streptomyces sp. NPDC048242]|uniref:YceI family protein n=1 Tax=Streptomyces sp. NPDC048242 TaxID=3155026 RepID=UPI00341E9C57